VAGVAPAQAPQRSRAAAVLLMVAAALTGCATRFENSPLAAGAVNQERRVEAPSSDGHPAILIAISGGGSRAAALGWAVLEQLKAASYPSPGEPSGRRRLIDDVVAVSSVSGGSITAAYFGLYGPDKLDSLEDAFFRPNNMSALLWRAANPYNWLRLKFQGNARITLLEELLDRRLFAHATFADMNQPGKPYVVLNATDMGSGEIFAFSPARFDDICSDFDRQPLATGVAASGAFPILLSPVALQDFSFTPTCASRPLPAWVSSRVLTSRYSRFLNLPEYKSAQYAFDLRHGGALAADRDLVLRKIDHVYLLDGGLQDNLGIHGLLEVLNSIHGPSIVPDPRQPGTTEPLLAAINSGDIGKLAVIIVNARTDPPNPVSTQRSRPGLLGMIGAVASQPIDATTASVNEQINVLLAQLQTGAGLGLQIYTVQVDIDQFKIANADEKALRDAANKVPTSYSISAGDLRVIEKSADVLLSNNPCFQRLLLDVGANRPTPDPQSAVTGCPQPKDRAPLDGK
jgi:NTE family protein